MLRRALASTAPPLASLAAPRIPHRSGARRCLARCYTAAGRHSASRAAAAAAPGVARLRGARAPADGRAGAQVGRAKKCLDFAATLYLLHLAAVSALSSFPRSFAWCARARPRRAR